MMPLPVPPGGPLARLVPVGAILALALGLAACVEPAPEPAPMPEDACGAGALQGLVGQSATVLDTMKFAGPVRILRPGMAVTMEFSPARLNILVDGREMIERVSCG